MNNNTPPFAIGQRVLCISTTPGGHYKKGEIYTVAACFRTKCCNDWRVGCEENHVDSDRFSCICGAASIHSGVYFFVAKASRFATIEQSYTDIRKELADSMGETKEVPDKILIPEKSN